MSPNTGFIFYNELYRNYTNEDWKEILTKPRDELKNTIDYRTKTHIKKINDKVINSKIYEILDYNELNVNCTFELKTTYPGLVLGTGYHHETGVEDEFKIGFYFDYTTGMPVIPGSSVKGLIRSAFPGREKLKNDKDTPKDKNARYYKKEKEEYIREKLGKDDSFDVEALENEIFEGIKDKNAKKAKDKYLSIYERDIFHDAVPIKLESDGLLKEDFLAPHKDNPLKNPIPLKFLKIAPGVTFRFQFDLKERDEKNRIITKEEKKNLFIAILLDFGIGAKTNVGYGQFNANEVLEEIKKEEQELKLKKRQEELDSMTEVEKKISIITEKGNVEKDVYDLYFEIDNFEGDEQIKAARFIKKYFKKKNKWKVRPAKKQYEKVQKIKSILGET